MRKQTWGMVVCVVGVMGVVAAQLGGCSLASLVTIPPIPLDLAGAGVAEFQVQAGTPLLQRAQFGGIDSPVAIGGGSLGIDPSAISIAPADTSGGKISVARQSIEDIQTCLDACEFAGIDTTTCSDVCENTEVHVNVWVGSVDEITADCANGDEYLFVVTLDESSQPVSVSVTPDEIQPATRALFNSGEALGLCVQVLSPFDGTILVNTINIEITLL